MNVKLLVLMVCWFDCYKLYVEYHDWSLCQFADAILDRIEKLEVGPIQ
jgi:hypothetical protein